ncbi:MAG: peptidoglycan D,D-transpeptidase FtsI family protein [Thainema sp.]
MATSHSRSARSRSTRQNRARHDSVRSASTRRTVRSRRGTPRRTSDRASVLSHTLSRTLSHWLKMLGRLRLPAWAYTHKFRLFLVWGILLVGATGLFINLVRIQVVQGEILQQRALEQQQTLLEPPVSRRPIVDRMNNAIAIDSPLYTLYAHPRMFSGTPQEMATALSPVIKQPVEALLNTFSEGETGLIIDRDLSETQATAIRGLRLDGLDLLPRQQREYPQGQLFGSVTGYVDTEGNGQAGLELDYEEKLKQVVTGRWLNRTGAGDLVATQVPKDLIHKDGLRLQLTLDSRLQRAVQEKLSAQISEYGAKRGAVMVMDARDGSLLALAQSPTYDPNQYYEADVDLFRSWVVSDLYEPGSTFKPINVAIALEAGGITADQTVYDEGRIQIGEWPIENFDYSSRGGRGPITIEDVLTYSSNVGMVHIMEQLSPEEYYDWLTWAGFNRLIGTDLPSEVPPVIKDREQFVGSRIEPATASFGQGLSLTPIKLLQLHGALANGGKLVVPHIVRGLVDPSGNIEWQPNRPSIRPIFSPETADAVVNMMETVVSDGTGKPAQIPGYRIAGKTGTAQKASPYGGYYENAKITSFVGIIPVDNPRYVVLAVVDEPQGDNAFGSTVAAPLVKSAMETLITIEGIPPSQPAKPTQTTLTNH